MSDLLVVGGGPVGLATALYAARAGLSVTVWEPRPAVIDKACGEGLMPGALAALAELEVDPPGQDLTGIRYVDGARSVDAPFRAGPGRGVRRTALHRSLRAAVDAAGVPVERRALRELRPDASSVTADGVRFGHVVAADGLHSPVRRHLGLQGREARLRRFGLRAHVRMPPWTSYVEVHWGRSAEVYVTPVAEDLVGLAVLTRVRAPYAVQLAGFPALAARLAGREPQEVRGAGPLLQRCRRRVAGRVLLVGDAGGYVDALTGEGVSLGLAQARAAVAAVVSGDLGSYERDWRAITRHYRVMTTTLLRGTQVPPLRRALVPAAAALPGVFGTAVHTLARPR